jgi:hypothetical protein
MSTKCVVLEVTDGEASHSGPGVAQKTGKAYDFWSQTAYLSSGAAYPTPITVRHDVLKGGENFLPLKPGFYLLPVGCFATDRVAGQVLRIESGPVPLDDGIADLQALAKAQRAAVAAVPRVSAAA